MSASTGRVNVIDHPLLAVKLSILRAKETPPEEFRRGVQEMSILLLGEAARSWETAPVEIETPLTKCAAQILQRPLVIVPILRAGLGMLEGIVRILPEANVGHIGLYRDATTLRPTTYFCRLPAELSEAQVVLVDPMLATGNTACEAVSLLKKNGAARIQFVCVVACPPGVERLQSAHADVEIFTAAIDPKLNEFGYIVPGLGDAGDRYFGTD
ncbi:MAG: uracil phosphoribosyltransferase [Spartobacteria bacterium]